MAFYFHEPFGCAGEQLNFLEIFSHKFDIEKILFSNGMC
jgi:hypothetical protein